MIEHGAHYIADAQHTLQRVQLRPHALRQDSFGRCRPRRARRRVGDLVPRVLDALVDRVDQTDGESERVDAGINRAGVGQLSGQWQSSGASSLAAQIDGAPIRNAP